VGLLTIGQGAWAADQSLGQDCLPAFVAAGGKVLVLPQTALPTWLPCSVQVDSSRDATMSYPCLPEHPVLAGVDPDGRDLCWWRGDHLVARGLFRKPQTGGFRILAEAGGRGGLLWTPLMELPDGRGWWVLSQYLLDEKLETEPMARQLVRNVLSYAAACRAPAEVRVAAVVSPAFAGYLDGLGLTADDLDGGVTPEQLGGHDLVIADGASLTAGSAASLRAFAERGGTVWLHCAEPANEEAVRALVPAFTRFGPAEAKGRATKRVRGGLASGLSNSDLFWYREDCWFEDWEGRGTGLIDEPCQTQLVLDKGATVYTRPGALAEVMVGRGRVVLDSLRLAEAAPAVADKARRIGSVLLTNLGVALGERSLAQAYRWEPLDLRPWLTTSLRDEVEGDGQGGWTDQGANDLRGLPAGRQTLGGVEFDIAGGCIALRSASHLTHAPTTVQSITVGARCDALAFLHAAAWAPGDGQTIAVCQVRYEDGQLEEIAMVDGAAVGDWWRPEDLPMASAAWRGANPVHEPVGLFRYVWRNPRPAVPIATLSVASANRDAVYLLVAISRGERR
jgi:hypothetical protein